MGRSKTRLAYLVRFVAGTLLVVAACLKLAGLKVSLAGQQPYALTSLLAAGEILLGAWLISGRVGALAWVVALVAFGLFTAVTARAAWIGQASCGCLGVVQVDPRWALLVDALVVVGLLVFRPTKDELRGQFTQSGPPLAAWVGGPALVVAATVAIALWQFGSLEASVAWLRDEPMYVTPGVVNLGAGRAGESKTARVTVANWTDRPIRLIGGTSDCACSVLGELPMTIPPHERREVPVTLRYPTSEAGAFTRSLALRTDCEQRRVVQFEITGVVRGEEAER